MIKTIGVFLLLLIIFFAAAIIQASFLPLFAVFGAVPNLLFIIFFLVIFFEPQQQYQTGFFAAIVAGLLSDVYGTYFGVSVVIFLLVYFFKKAVGHFMKESSGKTVSNYMLLFVICLVLHIILFSLASLVAAAPSVIAFSTVIAILYSALVAVVGFYIARALFFAKEPDNQLKLL